jgi:type 1 fimbria pilin
MPLIPPLAGRAYTRPFRNIAMKHPLNLLARGAVVMAACQSGAAMASETKLAPQECYWDSNQGVKIFTRDVGTLYVPRDARVGTVIGTAYVFDRTNEPVNHTLLCSNDGSVRLEADMRASVPIYPGQVDPIHGGDVTGKVLQTNIPGVGAVIELELPFDGRSANSFRPVTGRPIVPFLGINQQHMISPIRVSHLNNYLSLVKTGPIAPGPNLLDGSELFSGTFSTVGNVLRYGLTGTIIPAQCSVGGNPVSADPVQLGEWQASDFTGPGYTTTAVPFTITLNNCDTDTVGGHDTTANIQLDGVKGSVPVGPTTSGVFSLTTDSTAEGMGIQILLGDGITPIPLQAEIPMITITPGDSVLNFSARFYQTGASNTVRPGLAKGALSFTMTYK